MNNNNPGCSAVRDQFRFYRPPYKLSRKFVRASADMHWRRKVPRPTVPSLEEQEAKVVEEKKKLSVSLLEHKLHSISDKDKCEKRKKLLTVGMGEKKPQEKQEVRRIAHVRKIRPQMIMKKTIDRPIKEEIILADSHREKKSLTLTLEKKKAIPENMTQKILRDLLDKNVESLKALVECPKSDAEKVFLSAIEEKTRSSLTSAMRRLAEMKLQSQGHFNSRQMLEELETIVDPDVAVDFCAMPIETLHVFEQLFDMDFSDRMIHKEESAEFLSNMTRVEIEQEENDDTSSVLVETEVEMGSPKESHHHTEHIDELDDFQNELKIICDRSPFRLWCLPVLLSVTSSLHERYNCQS